MEINIDDVLNDSKEYGEVGDNVNDTLKAILTSQKTIMDKITELERKQMLLESDIVSDSRHIGALDNESQNPNVLDGIHYQVHRYVDYPTLCCFPIASAFVPILSLYP